MPVGHRPVNDGVTTLVYGGAEAGNAPELRFHSSSFLALRTDHEYGLSGARRDKGDAPGRLENTALSLDKWEVFDFGKIGHFQLTRIGATAYIPRIGAPTAQSA